MTNFIVIPIFEPQRKEPQGVLQSKFTSERDGLEKA
jgi:hypothetical protein